jgi:hypothetical protein
MKCRKMRKMENAVHVREMRKVHVISGGNCQWKRPLGRWKDITSNFDLGAHWSYLAQVRGQWRALNLLIPF